MFIFRGNSYGKVVLMLSTTVCAGYIATHGAIRPLRSSVGSAIANNSKKYTWYCVGYMALPTDLQRHSKTYVLLVI